MTNKPKQLTASRFLPECLKPEEISGDKRDERIIELLNWFDRYYKGIANPKWFKSHVAELCYYILNNAELQAHQKPAELKIAELANKFYERYPLETFKSDSERAEAFGYFMAGAELQCFGEFVKYEELCGDE